MKMLRHAARPAAADTTCVPSMKGKCDGARLPAIALGVGVLLCTLIALTLIPVNNSPTSQMVSLAVPAHRTPFDLSGTNLPSIMTADIRLLGVIVASEPHESLAVLSINNEPARVFVLHANIERQIKIAAITKFLVRLSDGRTVGLQTNRPSLGRAMHGIDTTEQPNMRPAVPLAPPDGGSIE